ncbi:SOS response-associated peptidase [Salipiger sp. PrR003]|uniref:SOS response-associated peptidase n=1 Tax=Salipiger sp. PrR003 TaxID=2706776 RepID=UPI0013DB63B0|nr:SOS response-associated peptidase [Salipiger sp. PrR003]NDV52958.1 SOS response-associated peptidase [Salipiger sp. PrR003]
MCNLYASTMPQETMRSLFKVGAGNDALGNFEPRKAIFPKYNGPVVRLNDKGERELLDMHWGLVMPQKSKKTGKAIQPKAINNARDDKLRSSGFWRGSFEDRRCLIPATSFCEAKGRSPATYFWFTVVDEDGAPEPYAFAGIWRHFKGYYKDDPVEIDTYSMVTSTPNDLVKDVHPDRMPVILSRDDYDTWLTGVPDDAFELLKPFPAERMSVIGQGDELKSEPEDSVYSPR